MIDYKKASIYYLVGNLFNRGIGFLTIPIFSRIMSTYDYGIINTYSSWLAVTAMVAGFALHMGIRAAFVYFRDEIDGFMSVVCTFTLIIGTIMVLVVVIFLLLVNIQIGSFLVILCFLQGLFSAILEDYSMYLMMQMKYKTRTFLMIVPNLISVIISLFVILFLLKSDLYIGKIIPTAFITIAAGVIVIILIYSRSKCL